MSVTNKDIVSTAKSYEGKLKYIFGSNDIDGGSGDCSSFTEHIYSLYGIDIGADTNAQYQQGYAVERDDIMAGDLIFFKDTYDSGHLDGVSHVGIAVDNDSFIHLSSSGCKVSSLNNSYYSKHYLATKRMASVAYENIEHSDRLEISKPTEKTENIELVWWGDIVKVVVVILIIGGGVTFLALSFTGKVKVPKLNTKKIVKDGLENE